MTKIAIVTSTVRPGRQSRVVADWVKSVADERGDATYEILDIADYNLPVWDEPVSPGYAPGQQEHSIRWSKAVEQYDGYIFVVAEYNHSITGALKNALDYLKPELKDKTAAFVSYGAVYGARAVEHLRGILSELGVAHVGPTAGLSLFHDFENFSEFKPSEAGVAAMGPMLDQLTVWTRALVAVREGKFDS